MKKFALISIILLFITTASAIQVNEKVGPYKVSFSSPVDVKMSTDIEHGETFSGFEYTSYNLYINTTNNKPMSQVSIFVPNNTVYDQIR
jgi:uncharacterized protein YpmB